MVLFEKVETCLGGLRTRLLSRENRLVLLKTVLGALPIYYMSIFKMPTGVSRRLEKTTRSFFWRGSQPEESQGVALVVWYTGLCLKVG